jgi:dipeptidase D
MTHITNLRPEALWNYFSDICKIPRISKHEEKIREWLKEFAGKHNLEFSEDTTGNILIVREASEGMEDRKTVVLQSHLDMVGEKNADHPHNWMKDPITPVVTGEWVTADGTTLGADDGIGIAAQLAILTDKTIKTGKVECLFTVDEESGMTGAINLLPGFFEGNILINLDSEDEGILFIGCAGGTDSIGRFNYETEPIPAGHVSFDLTVKGLTGGHSGDEIHKGFANSIKIMSRLLKNISESAAIRLGSLNGGNLRNAIPREAFATITFHPEYETAITNLVSGFLKKVKEEYFKSDPALTIGFKKSDFQGPLLTGRDSTRLLNLLMACPHGVLAWSQEMEGLVETSTNLASVRFGEGNTIEVVTTQRSSVESGKKMASDMVEACMILAGLTVTHSDGYPGWKPNLNSPILGTTVETYRSLFNTEPQVMAIHAGLECGLFYEKFEGLDMISFGPTIKGAHTPEERIDIKSTMKFWQLLTSLLERVPVK